MMKSHLIAPVLLACLMTVPMQFAPALAQDNAAETATEQNVANLAVDPEKLALAREMIEAYLPEDQRDAMMRGMIEPMYDTISKGMMRQGSFGDYFDELPELKGIFAEFLNKQMEQSLDQMSAYMPKLMEAMAIGYARKMDADGLRATRDFFASAQGQDYASVSFDMMSNPEIMAVQGEMMEQTMADLPRQIGTMQQQIMDAIEARKNTAEKNS